MKIENDSFGYVLDGFDLLLAQRRAQIYPVLGTVDLHPRRGRLGRQIHCYGAHLAALRREVSLLGGDPRGLRGPAKDAINAACDDLELLGSCPLCNQHMLAGSEEMSDWNLPLVACLPVCR